MMNGGCVGWIYFLREGVGSGLVMSCLGRGLAPYEILTLL